MTRYLLLLALLVGCAPALATTLATRSVTARQWSGTRPLTMRRVVSSASLKCLTGVWRWA